MTRDRHGPPRTLKTRLAGPREGAGGRGGVTVYVRRMVSGDDPASRASATSQRPTWRVVSARFEQSATGLGNAPAADLPEVAVAGRSNVGKSSLLNAFAGRRGLARVSRTPGRTRLLNFFHVELQHGTRRQQVAPRSLELRWVDLPGYGFAQAHKSVRDTFGPMIEGYLRDRSALRALVLLVDGRRGLRDGEFELLEIMSKARRPTLLVATKIDKLTASERGLLARRMADEVGVDPRDILLTSSQSGEGLGDDPRRGGLARDLADLVADDA